MKLADVHLVDIDNCNIGLEDAVIISMLKKILNNQENLQAQIDKITTPQPMLAGVTITDGDY